LFLSVSSLQIKEVLDSEHSSLYLSMGIDKENDRSRRNSLPSKTIVDNLRLPSYSSKITD